MKVSTYERMEENLPGVSNTLNGTSKMVLLLGGI